MKKLTTLVITLSLFIFGGIQTAPAVFADNATSDTIGICNTDSGYKTDVCKGINAGNGANNPAIDVIRVAIQIFAFVLGVAAVIVVVVSGLRFITAQGDPQGVSGAKRALAYALVGLIIAALAQVFVVFILSKVG